MPAATPPSNCFANSNRAAIPGAIAVVAAYVSRFRQAQGLPPGQVPPADPAGGGGACRPSP